MLRYVLLLLTLLPLALNLANDPRVKKCSDKTTVNIEDVKGLDDSPIAIRSGKKLAFDVVGDVTDDIAAEEELLAEFEFQTKWALFGWASVCGWPGVECWMKFNCTKLHAKSGAPHACPVKKGKFKEHVEFEIPLLGGMMQFFAAGSYRPIRATVKSGDKLVGCAEFNDFIFHI